MAETLFHAYTPLIFWTGLGLLLLRFLPKAFPQFLGRTLYWVGVPVEILSLARRTNFSEGTSLAIAVTVATLTTGLALACVSLLVGNRVVAKPAIWVVGRPCQGSFILSSMLGNTGFIGLAIAPLLVSDRALGLVVFYSITQNIVGTYGLGVFLASYFGRSSQDNRWWTQIRDVLCVPSLWAFILGLLTQRGNKTLFPLAPNP